MSFAWLRSFRRTLALRLTIWYAAIFAASSVLAFAFVYALTATFVGARTDEDLRQDLEEFAALYRREGIDGVRKEVALTTQGREAQKVFFRAWTREGTPLLLSDMSSWPDVGRVPDGVLRRLDEGAAPVFATLDLPARGGRVRTAIAAIAPGIAVEVGQSLEQDAAFMADVLRGFVATLAVVLLLGGPVGWFMARRALRGVEEVTNTANQITAGRLDRRVPVGGRGDELDRLAATFNAMLDRIQGLIVGMRHMADNLAHDLRSPLARIRASAETSLANGTPATQESSAVSTIEECDRLLEMINTTLDIAEADSGAAKLNLDRIDLAEIVASACDLFQTVADDNRIELGSRVPEHCYIQGDRQRLQRAIANLLDNALKYTPAGGRVDVSLQDQGAQVVVTVADTGEGISADDLPRIFQRFYRCDKSRSRHGVGLGLNLARAFVRAHGGNITAASAAGAGSTFAIVLPRLFEAFPRSRAKLAPPHPESARLDGD